MRMLSKRLIVADPFKRDTIAASCPRCHGDLRQDVELSAKESAPVLICETCGFAFELLPLYD